jgi:hypothetical protein
MATHDPYDLRRIAENSEAGYHQAQTLLALVENLTRRLDAVVALLAGMAANDATFYRRTDPAARRAPQQPEQQPEVPGLPPFPPTLRAVA